MVLPFLSKYLKEDLHFSYSDVGWIMVAFGVGSLGGSWLGGKLSDKIGFYKIMLFSLFVSGLILILLQYITSFLGLCLVSFFGTCAGSGFGSSITTAKPREVSTSERRLVTSNTSPISFKVRSS